MGGKAQYTGSFARWVRGAFEGSEGGGGGGKGFPGESVHSWPGGKGSGNTYGISEFISWSFQHSKSLCVCFFFKGS